MLRLEKKWDKVNIKQLFLLLHFTFATYDARILKCFATSIHAAKLKLSFIRKICANSAKRPLEKIYFAIWGLFDLLGFNCNVMCQADTNSTSTTAEEEATTITTTETTTTTITTTTTPSTEPIVNEVPVNSDSIAVELAQLTESLKSSQNLG